MDGRSWSPYGIVGFFFLIFNFIRTLRARDFPTERVLSRTPLIIRCRHAALDRMLHRPTETYVGDPEHCRELDDSPDDPGVANAWDSFGERGAFGGAPSRGA